MMIFVTSVWVGNYITLNLSSYMECFDGKMVSGFLCPPCFFSCFFFFFFFFFLDYFSSYETGQSVGGAKSRENRKKKKKKKNTWYTRKQNLACLTCGQSEARTHTRHNGEMIE